MNTEQNKLLKRYNSRFLFKTVSFFKLPLAFFTGLKIVHIDEHVSKVSTRLSFITKNPFRSTYFAVLSMAAELSTGLYALLFITGIQPSVAVIITGLNARFLKKATGTTIFTCREGEKLRQAVIQARETGEPAATTVKSIGKNEAGETVAEFEFTWSFKQRTV